MSTLTRIKPSAYHDSVTLMLVAQAVLKLPGVQDAAVVMGTPANREIIGSAGLLTPEAAGARPDDLLIVIRAEDEASALAALAEAEQTPGREGAPCGSRRGAAAQVAGFSHRHGAGRQPGGDLGCGTLRRGRGAHRA